MLLGFSISILSIDLFSSSTTLFLIIFSFLLDTTFESNFLGVILEGVDFFESSFLIALF